MPARPLTILALAAGTALAGDLESWNQVSVTLAEGSRARWSGFGVIRVRESLSSAYDHRLGTVVRVQSGRRLTLAGGYLLRRVKGPVHGFHNEHWLFGGPAFILSEGVVTTRAGLVYERHIGQPGRPDFNRYRPRIDLERVRQGISPFLFEELFFVREGFARSRTRIGFRYRFPRRSRLDVAYQFETNRSGAAWPPRHAIVTSVSIGVPVEEQ